MDQPMNTNDTPRPRSTGITSGVWNRPPTAGARSHTSPMQTRPIRMPAVDAARTSSSLSSGFCTRAEASPMRAKILPEQHDEVRHRHQPELGRPEQARDRRGVGEVGDHERHGGQCGPAQAGCGLSGQVRAAFAAGGALAGRVRFWRVHSSASPNTRNRAADAGALQEQSEPSA